MEADSPECTASEHSRRMPSPFPPMHSDTCSWGASMHGTFSARSDHLRPETWPAAASKPTSWAPPSRSLSQAFGQDSTQDEVFEYAAKPIIDAVLDGYNGESER